MPFGEVVNEDCALAFEQGYSSRFRDYLADAVDTELKACNMARKLDVLTTRLSENTAPGQQLLA